MKPNKLRPLLLTAVFAVLTAIGAFLRIPVGHSSFSLQLFFSLMAGLILGPYWGAASQLLYVLLGLVGLPVFSQGGGLMYVANPTFGFLLGLIPAAFFAGCFRSRRRLTGYALALLSLYALGLPYLWLCLRPGLSFSQALVSGCLIFLPFDGLKILCAQLLSRRLPKNLLMGQPPF